MTKTHTPPTFEAAMMELETLVQQMESGQLPLEEAIKAFEHGQKLRQFCQQRLDDAKMRVDKITEHTDGSTGLEPFATA